jgi:peptide-methionine (S)-S-oxide reductase
MMNFFQKCAKVVIIILFLLPQLFINAQNSKSGNMNKEIATFGTGCFWCTEAIFSQLKGVLKVTSGYSGGHTINPTYKEVCEGNTGHAECIQVEFDPTQITFDELLEVFWQTHDPTTLNRQGADIGTQYRSVIFYHNVAQENSAENYLKQLNESKIWDKPVVTEITRFDTFYQAEDYHKEYYNNNSNQGYCRITITPKIEKFRKIFKDKLITE